LISSPQTHDTEKVTYNGGPAGAESKFPSNGIIGKFLSASLVGWRQIANACFKVLRFWKGDLPGYRPSTRAASTFSADKKAVTGTSRARGFVTWFRLTCV
jgi:hypothetical protein